MLAYRNRLVNELSRITEKFIDKNIPRSDTHEYNLYQTARALRRKRLDAIECSNMFDGLPLVNFVGPRLNESDYYCKNEPTLCLYGTSKRYKRRKMRNRLKHAERMVRKLALSQWQMKLYASQADWRNEIQEQEIMDIIESQEHIPRISINTSPSRKRNLRRRSRELNSPSRKFFVSSDSSSDDEIIESSMQQDSHLKKIFNKLPVGPWSNVGKFLNKSDDELSYIACMARQERVYRNISRADFRKKKSEQLHIANLRYMCNERADIIHNMNLFDKVIAQLKSKLYNRDFSNFDLKAPMLKYMFNLTTHSKDDVKKRVVVDNTVVGPIDKIQMVPIDIRNGIVQEAFFNEDGKVVQANFESTRFEKAIQEHIKHGPLLGSFMAPQDDERETAQNTFTTYVLTSVKDLLQTHIDNKTSGAPDLELFIEGFVDTLWLMYKQSNMVDTLHVLKLYICLRYNISIGKIIIDFIMSLFNGLTTQDDDGVEQLPFTFKSLFNDWKGFYHGEFLAKIIKAIACLVSLGLCKMIKLPFNMEKFAQNYCDKGLEKKSWPDLMTCVIDVAIYVFEHGYKWFTGKMTFLDVIRSPSMSRKYDEDFSLLTNNINLYEVNELHRINMDKYQYECLHQEITQLTKAFYDKAGVSTEKNLMRMNLRKLDQVANKMVMTNSCFTLREAPFSYYLYGQSSVGKSTLVDIINNALLRANNLPHEPKYQVSINASDSYQSEVQPYHLVIGCDDIANIKAEHEDGNSMKIVLDYVGNTAVHALKADVESKGKVLLKPKIFHATTNVKEVEAHVKSNEPLAILRRLGICITVTVRPEFRKENTHMLDPNKMANAINDAWSFCVQEARPNIHDSLQFNKKSSIKWVMCTHNGCDLDNIGLKTLLDFLIYRSKIHYVQQAGLVASIENIQKTALCEHNNYATLCDACSTVLETQDDETCINRLLEISKLSKFYHYIYDFLPYYVLDRPGVSNWLRWFIEDNDITWIKKVINVTAMSLVCQLIYVGFSGGIFAIMLFITFLFIYFLCLYMIVLMMHSEYKKMRQRVMSTIEPIVSHRYKILAGLGVTVGIVMMLKKLRKVTPLISMQLTAQGSSYSTPKPDDIQKKNMWLKPHVEKPIVDHKVETTTREQMIEMVEDSIGYATYDCDSHFTNADIFPYKGNVWICNHHTISKRKWDTVTVKRRKSDVSLNRTVPIHATNWLQIPGTDLALITLSGLGDVRDFSEYFPDDIDKFVAEPVTWIYKNDQRDIIKCDFLAQRKRIVFKDVLGDGRDYDYPGYTYDMPISPVNGQCMAPIICRGKYPLILGFHSSGNTDAKVGCANTVSKAMLESTYQKLFNQEFGDRDNVNVQVHSSCNMKLDFPEYNIFRTDHIHDKSPFNFLEQPACVALYGAHTGNRRRFRSKVEPSIISESVTRICGVPRHVGPPKNISNWKPWHADAIKVTATRFLDIGPLILANIDFENHILNFLEDNKQYKELVSPLSRVSALSGVDGCRGIDAIKLSTSAGFPRCKPKKHYVFESDQDYENISRPLDVSQDIWDEIDRLEDILADGKRVYFIHRINLKDEPTKLEKEKVRTFAGCTLECLILIRTYFLPIAKMIMDNSEVFECAVGVNAHGPDWTKLTLHMQKFGEDRTIAGDYANYDSEMWCHLVLMAFAIMISIAQWCGYSDRQLCIMRGLATELAYGLTEYNGEYAMFLAQMLSGHAMTVFVNSFVNSLYMRFAYYAVHTYVKTQNGKFKDALLTFLNNNNIQPDVFMETYMSSCDAKVSMFADSVSLMCYGDDNKMSVSSDIPWFNHCTIATVLGMYNVQYTMADKTSKSVPYIHSSECSFLKRYSVWDEGYKQFLAPIEMSSIWKTLHANVVSDVISREQQSAESISCVMREMFYHGEMKYHQMMLQLQQVIEECKLTCYYKQGRLPTYSEQESDYINNYLCLPDIKNDGASESSAEIAKNDDMLLDTTSSDICDGKSLLGGLTCQGRDSYLGMSSPAQKPYPHSVHNLKTNVVLFEIANQNNNENGTTTNKVGTVMGAEKHQNMIFRDGTEQWTSGIEGAYDETREVGINDETNLADFFSRPVRVPMPDWVPGSVSKYTFVIDPWTTFFTNKRVANRITNYHLMQSTLKVKIVINGNAFYYGRLMADYLPLSAYNTVDAVNTLDDVNIVQASQRPHIYINPTTSQGGELTLPFIHPNNAINLRLGTFSDLGTLYVREVNGLKHANASTTNVSLNMYIWAENVRLSVPTTHNMLGLTTQDEYGSKPVSNMMSSAAKIAGMFTSVPTIGPYAKATQMVATGIGKIAKMLGYARPAMIEDPTTMKPRMISRLANVDCGDCVTKLSVDSKQELSIDPRIVGIGGNDDMSIKYIAGVETYLCTVPWTTSMTVDDFVFNLPVTPYVVRTRPGTTNTSYAVPACAFAGLPFNYWRGTMRYRFQIVCSEYHRGRLRVVYDPTSVINNETNIGFNRIIDLCDETDFTIDVAWGQDTTFLSAVGLTGMSGNYLPTTQILPYIIGSNGVIAMYVVNDLTTPNSTINNDISINVSISMCDDVEFAAPRGSVIESLTFNPQDDEVEKTNDNAPIMTSNDDNIMECNKQDHTLDVYFGESITSFRSLMRRYCYHSTIEQAMAARSMWTLDKPDFPTYRGISQNGINVVPVVLTPTYNTNTTIMNYLAPAYLAYRGGVRWKYVVSGYSTSKGRPSIVQRLNVGSIVQSNTVTAVPTDPNALSRLHANLKLGSTGGTEVTLLGEQPVLEVDLPYYSDSRFSISKNIGNTTALNSNKWSPFFRNHRLLNYANEASTTTIDAYCAASEDSGFYLFLGCPPIGIYALQ